MNGIDKRQYVKFTFFKLDKCWKFLSDEDKAESKEQFLSVLEEFSDQMLLLSYSTVGMRGDTDFLLWKICDELELIQRITTQLLSTKLGHYLDISYSYLAMTKKSVYTDKHHHVGQGDKRFQVEPIGAKYLFVYPFVKIRDWYLLDKHVRQTKMDAHITIGHKYPSVKINTTYSFG